MKRPPVVRNVTVTVLQVLIGGASFFLLYRYVLRTLGAESLGIWSLVLATTSLGRLTELGLTGSSLKFVAQYLARHDSSSVIRVVETASLTILASVGALILLAFPLLVWLLRINLETYAYQTALLLLPWALTSFLVNSVTGILGSALEGFHRFDLRAYSQIGGHVLLLVAAVALIPAHQLEGLAFAQLFQAVSVLGATWLLLRRTCPGLPLLPYRFSLTTFRELIGYGFQFQVGGIAFLFCDPVTKMLLARFGGLSLTAHYEMASRLVLQLRALLVSANRVLIPVFAELHEQAPQRLAGLYRESLSLIFYLSVPAYGLLLATTPMIAIVWIGSLETSFLLFSAVLCLAWQINTLAGPAYIANLGVGRLRWNTIGHLLIALANVVLGLALGTYWGGVGVVFAWAFALALGSWLIRFTYERERRVASGFVATLEDGLLLGTVLVGVGATWALFFYLHSQAPLPLLLSLALMYPLVLALPVWRHPRRERLFGLVFSSKETSSAASVSPKVTL